jgi:hypothetical protein
VIAEQLRVRAVLESLSQMDQEVLRLTEWERLDLSEAAAVLGCSRTAALRLDMRKHPELANDPRALAMYLRSLTPWIDHPLQSGEPEDVSVFTIHPDAIPSGDQLLILPQWHPTEGGTTDDPLELRSLIVPALPQCVPSPEDSIMTSNGIEPR